MAADAPDAVTAPDPPALAILGLTQREEDAYSWLVDKGSVTISEIAATWDRWWPPEEVTVTLAALRGRGLVSIEPGPPAVVLACPPESVLERQITLQESALNVARRRIATLEKRYRLAPNNTGAVDIVDVVYGADAIHQRVGLSLMTARRDVRGFDKPPYFVERHDNRIELESLARGVRHRVVYDRSALEYSGYLPIIERLMDAGEEARVFDGVPMKLGLVDDHEAFVPLQRDPTVVAELFVRSSALLNALSALFELVWAQAVPLRTATASPAAESLAAEKHHDEQPTAQESQLLYLLTTGISDEAICRHVGISQRTFQRRLQRLQSRVGAQSRFQLAHQAARRGWL